MHLSLTHTSDVLVIGCGIAGLSAALRAAESGCSVTLLTSAKLFSGSSFYPGTWGLGLIGPEDDSDRASLAASIQKVGCGMATPAMVDAFVSGIHPAIERVRAMGVKLRRAVQKDQREFIPCFDHKTRDWNGIEFDSARPVFFQKLQDLGVTTMEHCQVLDLAMDSGRVTGAVAVKDEKLLYLGAKAVVLATGGYGSLFRYHLCTGDVSGQGQALALKAGCSLVNMEFMQMMPGYISPAPKTVFDEKTFRFTRMRKNDGTPLHKEGKETEELLSVRSGHGPFTSRLVSREVDLALFRAFLEDPKGVEVTYTEEMRQNPPEFVTTYFDWLKKEKGLTPEDPIHIGIFAHAANGGVVIDENAFTGVEGLFACGEVTGGMHGADRIGGLSTANGLVFGTKAGVSAAEAVRHSPAPAETVEFTPVYCADPAKALAVLQETMFQNAMILRTEEGLLKALQTVEKLKEGLSSDGPFKGTDGLAAACRLSAQLTTATCVLKAALLRRESRGSHYRADFPAEKKDNAKQILVKETAGQVTAAFREEA